MKKIILSLSMIAVVAIAVAGATGAFFSDTETSTGNTFTAGAIDLTVDSTQHYNGNESVGGVWVGGAPYPIGSCDGTWTATDLGAGQKFFNFGDVKPGDSGENTISLHVNNNDAWVRLVIKDVTNDEMTCTEPETKAETNPTCVPGTVGQGNGELRQNLLFSMWLDEGVHPGFDCPDGEPKCSADLYEGDNVKQTGEPELISTGTIDPDGTAETGISEIWTLSTPLLGGQTAYFGVDWSLPYTVGNETQTDSMSATMEFQVEQSRNNPTAFD